MVINMKAEFHFDFGSPNAYFCHAVLPALEARTGVTFTYVPILLGGVFKLTNNQPPMLAFRDVRNKLDYQRIEIARFITRHGLTRFRFNPNFPVNTLLIMRGAVAADMAGQLRPYADAMFRAMWEDGAKLDDADVVLAALNAAGLDGAALLAATQQAEIKDWLLQSTQASVERGTFGAPTFYLDDEIFFGKDSLPDLEYALQNRR